MEERARVFISHSAREGAAGVLRQAIYQALLARSNRYTVLMDDVSLEPGSHWRARINLWLNSCDAAIVILSPDALHSNYVAFELAILGYRAWDEGQHGREFRIIPVFADVTMKQVEASALAPSQAGEWMGIIEGNAATVAAKVVAALDGVTAATSRPVERLARVLDGYLPETDIHLDDASAALGLTLPWEIGAAKGFSLALQLLGSGMSVGSTKAIRRLREDPTFVKEHLQQIVELVASAWVDLKADEIPALVQAARPPALVLNAGRTDLARMYLQSAKYRVSPSLQYQLAESTAVIEERPDVPALTTDVVEAICRDLYETLGIDSEAGLAEALDDYEALGEAVVVALSAPSISLETIRELRKQFDPRIAFFLLTGPRKDNDRLKCSEVYVIRPPLDGKDEELCRTQYDDFCRRLNRK